MTADIARFTYDPTREYRYLIRQQGRVTLEADENEATALASETLRLETIDLIGPAVAVGTGCEVSASGNTLTINIGVFYLGGWRLELDAPVNLANQPDWLDAPAIPTANTLVIALLLTEQSVCAVEDQALLEVALGGPDSAARARLMQHFLPIPISGNNCQDAATTVNQLLGTDGCSLGPSNQILSQARLKARFVPGPPATDPCTPAAAGGYLGADNQMVRVTIWQFDSGSQTGSLLWGWNNASLLYRATMASDPYTLNLITVPVDEEHAPQQGQWVEILRSQADLGDNNYIADEQGFITYLAEGYSFDTGTLVLHDPLPALYQANKPPLFVRLWQASVPFNAGQATALDNVSGLTVTVTLPALPTQIAARPFWRFAVRPATPQAIYPARYLETPQPPDGPRQWITDLAVVSSSSGGGWTVIADCRIPFGPQGSPECDCCGIVLGPRDVVARGGLQQVINDLMQSGNPARLSLKAGTYRLEATLQLNAQDSDFILEGCTSGVVIEGDPKQTGAFSQGLVHLDGVSDLTLRMLTFVAPMDATAVKNGGSVTMGAIVITAASQLLIEDCTFNLVADERQPFGGGVIVLGESQDVTLRGNTFATTNSRGAPLFGVLGWVSANNSGTTLSGWEITDNRFGGLMVGVFAYAQLGLIRCCDNIITECGSGIILAEANLGATKAFADVAQQNAAAAPNANLAQAAAASVNSDLFANVISQGASLVATLSLPKLTALSSEAQQVLAQQMSDLGAAAYSSLAASAAAQPARAKGRTPKSAKAAPVTSADPEEFQAANIVAEAFENPLVPAVRIEDNEITLATELFTDLIGICVINALSQKGVRSPSTTMVSGNRVATPTYTVPACALVFPGGAVVTGNIFTQATQNPTGAPSNSLIVFTLTGQLQVAGNVIQYGESIWPVRTLPAPTPSWEFFNTVAD
jgi:hypothetical protein